MAHTIHTSHRMRRIRRLLAILATAVLLAGQATGVAEARPGDPVPNVGAPPNAWAPGWVRLALVTSGLNSPVAIANADDDSNRLFIVEQRGTVKVIKGGVLQPGFFLDIRSVPGGISSGGERGLLGVAFHPDFETNRKLFVYYTRADGDVVIAEMTANAAGTSAAVGTLDPLLTIEHSSYTNHNGGQLLFGPDDYLYAFIGDGGGSGNPLNTSQDLNSLLGKTLRIDPDLSGGYANPAGNPFAGATAGRDEIWNYGLRNPWRASFDDDTGELWIADVGQGTWEEINREPALQGGRNYGWPCREGLHAYRASCSGGSFTNPVAEYGHAGGHCAVTGGFVYRGDVFEDFEGRYVLGDYCSGYLWTLVANAASPTLQFHRNTSALISSFGESEKEEIYLADHAGRIYRVVAPPFSDVTNSVQIDHITWMYYADITTGCGGGRYCPNSSVQRGEMAAFLDRALSLPPTANDYFNDDNGSPFEISINRLAAAGISTGCGGGNYCPNATVTRAEMASFLARAFNLPASPTDWFTDDNSSIHEDNINRVAAAGITTGCTATTFCPNGATNREQMAAFIHRAVDD